MFYSEQDIVEHLSCPSCRQPFDAPNFLPCGNSLCSVCVFELYNADMRSECGVCNEFHNLPRRGFPSNQTIVRLMEKKAAEVYRNKTTTRLNKHLREIQIAVEELTTLS
jgi:hypothetical protein